MLFKALEEYEIEAYKCPNFQHKITETDEQAFNAVLVGRRKELLPSALDSFKKFTTTATEAEKTNLLTSWAKITGMNVETQAREIRDSVAYFRYLAQINLFFLCKMLEKYKDIAMGTHEVICNDFFVVKDPTVLRFEDFAKSYQGLKDRLLLVPRGGFKSSIDIGDCVQWIICYPEVTILIMTGRLDLAKDFVGELKQHFTLQQEGSLDENDKPKYIPKKTYDGSPNLFQVLFPEHNVKPGDDKQTEFNTPANKMPDKEATVTAASIEQALSGFHYGVMKLDDVVTNENSCTLTRLETVNKQVSVNRAMLHPFGFFDKIGTWYDENDIYGIDIKYEEKLKEEGETPSMLIHLKSAWWPTDEAKKLGRIEDEMQEQDWVLWFPERLTYKFLRAEKKKDPEGFAIKYENDPRKVHQIKFPRELLIRRTIPANTLPQQGMIVTTVDTAYSTKSWADYTVILTALIFGGKFYVIDMSRGRYNDIELPKMIASTGFKWKPKRIAVEDSVGVRWMNREIRREMDRLGISIPIEYVSLGVGNKTKAKDIKAKPVLRLLGDERLYFSNSCVGLEELYTELEKFGGTASTHDDIVSALSILVDQFAAYADMDAKLSFVQQSYTADTKSKERHDMVYGLGKFANYNQNYALTENNVADLPSFAKTSGMADSTGQDPLADLFI